MWVSYFTYTQVNEKIRDDVKIDSDVMVSGGPETLSTSHPPARPGLE